MREARNNNILKVYRSKAQAKKSYDKMSRFYDYFAGGFESNYRNKGLDQLNIQKGETVLEIGFGTGHCLKQMAILAGETGKVYGVDISSGMIEVTRRRLEKAKLMDRVELYCGDALNLPYNEGIFDSAFMSFTLELFDIPEIPMVLREIKRVMKTEGRLGVVAMSKDGGRSRIINTYEWAHKNFPKYVDCRPIFVEHSLKEAGFSIKKKDVVKIFGLPIEVIIAMKLD